MNINALEFRQFLLDAGMPASTLEKAAITQAKRGGLGACFKISLQNGSIYYLKFSSLEGARGGYLLKHLIPIADETVREHTEKRCKFIRKLLDNLVVEKDLKIVPRPCYFDLQPLSMEAQKIRKGQEVFAEYRVNENNLPKSFPSLLGTVGTLWQGLDLEQFKQIPLDHPLSVPRREITNPIDYDPEDVFKWTALLGTFQNESQKFLDTTLEPNPQSVKKRSPEELQRRLNLKLRHEQRALKGFDLIMKDFLQSLGIIDSEHVEEDLKRHGTEVLAKIDARIKEYGASSIEELARRFLEGMSIPKKEAEALFHGEGEFRIRFQHMLFEAESKRWWTAEERKKAKAIDQLAQAEAIAKKLVSDPQRIIDLIGALASFKQIYADLESLPKGIVPQDAHPRNFLRAKDGSVTMLDLDDVSMDARIADLSNVYLFKILKAAAEGIISKDRALTYIQKALQGYNSGVDQKLTSNELSLLADFSMGAFLNLLPQLGIILRMDPHELDSYNLAMSIDAFLKEFDTHQRISTIWREQFLPSLVL